MTVPGAVEVRPSGPVCGCAGCSLKTVLIGAGVNMILLEAVRLSRDLMIVYRLLAWIVYIR